MKVLFAPLRTIASMIGRLYARSIHPWSVISMEVMLLRAALMTREATVLKRLSFLLTRNPPT